MNIWLMNNAISMWWLNNNKLMWLLKWYLAKLYIKYAMSSRYATRIKIQVKILKNLQSSCLNILLTVWIVCNNEITLLFYNKFEFQKFYWLNSLIINTKS